MFEKNGVVWSGIDDEYRHNLERCFWSRYFKGDPFEVLGEKTMIYLSVKEVILSYAGEDVCVNPVAFDVNDELDLKIGLHGKPISTKGLRCPDRMMEPNGCFRNAFIVSSEFGYQLCLGFYMSEDGMWRKHAWCLDNGKIVETTNVQAAYFGYVVEGEDLKKYIEEYMFNHV